MDKQKIKHSRRQRRKKRVRKKILGSPERPRLSVFRSLRNVYAQLIDDESGLTLVSAGSQDKELSREINNSGNSEAAAKVGEAIARKALAIGVHQVCLDRNGYLYHGRVKTLAEAARKAGLSL